MSENTKIEWCDHTWSPWRRRSVGWVLAKSWGDPVKWNRVAGNGKCDCCGSTRDASNTGNCKRCGEIDRTFTRPRVFVHACDWLDPEAPIEWLARFLALIHDTPNLDWMLLTKRPEKWYGRIFDALLHVEGITDPDLTEQDPETEVGEMLNDWSRMDVGYAPKNVWVGTSIEDQQRADERLPALLKIPARRRFISVEPMIGPVDLSMWLPNGGADGDTTAKHNYDHPEDSIHWVIVGGESGPSARPCNVEWIRSIVVQCAAAGVPCFVKQLGSDPFFDPSVMDFSQTGKGISRQTHPKGGDPAEWPEDLRVRQFPEVKP